MREQRCESAPLPPFSPRHPAFPAHGVEDRAHDDAHRGRAQDAHALHREHGPHERAPVELGSAKSREPPGHAHPGRAHLAGVLGHDHGRQRVVAAHACGDVGVERRADERMPRATPAPSDARAARRAPRAEAQEEAEEAQRADDRLAVGRGAKSHAGHHGGYDHDEERQAWPRGSVSSAHAHARPLRAPPPQQTRRKQACGRTCRRPSLRGSWRQPGRSRARG